jgi:hypothetical protein
VGLVATSATAARAVTAVIVAHAAIPVRARKVLRVRRGRPDRMAVATVKAAKGSRSPLTSISVFETRRLVRRVFV